ncbi:MAG: hypothetical protein M1816_001949 [Peltula sp. TS41687]|nr:MAG: hypothetical protein M1816_001949 [Peltula sp. TS41687]
MPHWGRPRGNRQRPEEREWEQRRRLAEQRRFVELDTDFDDGGEPSWDVDVRPRRFTSDELYFTGVDLGAHPRRTRQIAYREDSEHSSEASEPDERYLGDVQVTLRDKEKELARTAMERIRRAQMLGKSNVRLSRSEYEALERERRRAEASKRTEDRSVGGTLSQSGGRGQGRGQSQQISSFRRRGLSDVSSRKSRSKQVYDPESPPYIPEPEQPAPLNYQAPRKRKSLNPLSRPPSSPRPPSRKAVTPPYPTENQPQPSRYFSLPEAGQQQQNRAYHARSRSRTPPSQSPLPFGSDHSPRARSRSTAQPPHPLDPFQYQTHPPLPVSSMSPRYTQGQRGASGPPDVQYELVGRRPQHNQAHIPRESRIPAGSSDPYLVRRWPAEVDAESEGHSEGDSGSRSDENDARVEVEIRSTGDVRRRRDQTNLPGRWPRRRRG